MAGAWPQRIRGKVELDGPERVSSQTVLDVLEVPQRKRTAGTFRRLAKLMAELGWTAVRVRDLTRGGYKEQVRGWMCATAAVQIHQSVRWAASAGTSPAAQCGGSIELEHGARRVQLPWWCQAVTLHKPSVPMA